MTNLPIKPPPSTITILGADTVTVTSVGGVKRQVSLTNLGNYFHAGSGSYTIPPLVPKSESPDGSTITDATGVIYDAALNSFALVTATLGGLGVALNGTYQANTANVTKGYYNKTKGHFFQQNSAGNWFEWTGTAYVAATSPILVVVVKAESADKTTITDTAGVIYDPTLNAFTLVTATLGGLGVALNGAYQANTANVTKGYYSKTKGHFFQQNSVGNWYEWAGGPTYLDATDPTVAVVVAPPAMVVPTTAAGSLTVNLGTQTGQTVYGTTYGFSTGVLADNGFSRCNDPAIVPAIKLLQPTIFRVNVNANVAGAFWQDKVFANGLGSPDWQWFDNLFTYSPNWFAPNTQIILGVGGANDSMLATDMASRAAALVRRSITIGRPIKMIEVGNEPNGKTIPTLYNAWFNAVADAVHAVDATIKVMGPVWSLVPAAPAAALTDWANACGAKAGGICMHTYGFGYNGTRTGLYAMSSFVDQINSIRSSVAGTPAANLPIFAGGWNIVGDGSNPPEQIGIAGAIYAGLSVYRGMNANVNFQWGAYWECYGHGTYGAVNDPSQNYFSDHRVFPAGYLLSYAGQQMDGKRVTTTLNVTGNIVQYAVVSGTKFCVQIINFDTATAFNGFPVAIKGMAGISSTVTVHQINAQNATPVITTPTYALLMASGINMPAESITHISGTFSTTAPPLAEVLTVATPTAKVTGIAFAITGTYANVTPTALDYSLNAGSTWVAAPSPVIGSGAFSFQVTLTATNTAQTVRVRDHNATSITAASGSFAVTAPAVVHTESASNATLTTTTGTIYDAGLNAFTLVAAQNGLTGLGVAYNGVYQVNSANVTLALYYTHVFYQKNSAGNWYSWNGTSYADSADPRPPAGTGAFAVSGGKFYDPTGVLYYARGTNCAVWAATGYGGVGDGGNGTSTTPGGGVGDGKFLLTLFPKCNQVRLNCSNGEADGKYDNFINNLTAVKCVVVLEDHNTDNGASWNQSNSLAWYGRNAGRYKTNPYVWFGTVNEPNPQTPAVEATQHLGIYNAVRNAGNNNPVMIGLNTDVSGNGGSQNPANGQASTYSGMKNIGWDLHQYPFGFSSGSTTPATVTTYANTYVRNFVNTALPSGGCTSSDGVMPIIMGEFGDSSNTTTVNAQAEYFVLAIMNSTQLQGGTAWTWKADTADLLQVNGVRTKFGDCVNAWMNGATPASWTASDGH